MPFKPIVMHHRYASPSFWPSLAEWSSQLRDHQLARRRGQGARSTLVLTSRRSGLSPRSRG